MTSIIKVIGGNGLKQFGATVSSSSPDLVDAGMNKRSTKITEIISGKELTIYCEKGYKNVWTAECMDNVQQIHLNPIDFIH